MNLQSSKHVRKSALTLFPGIQGQSHPLEDLAGGLFERACRILELPRGGLEEGGRSLLNRTERGCVLVGFSFGGLLAWHMACIDPTRFRGLVLIGTLPSLDSFPKGLALQAKLLPYLPDAFFEALYARKHNWTTAPLPSRQQLLRRLKAIREGFPSGPPLLPVLFIYGSDQKHLASAAEGLAYGRFDVQVRTVVQSSRVLQRQPLCLLNVLHPFLEDCDSRHSSK